MAIFAPTGAVNSITEVKVKQATSQESAADVETCQLPWNARTFFVVDKTATAFMAELRRRY